MNGDTQASSSNVCVTNGFTLQAVLYSIQAESENPRQRVSNADQKVFANPESFYDMVIIGSRISG